MFEEVPETMLEPFLARINNATFTKNKAIQFTAVRWFNRLYFDVRRWNEKFIKMLRTIESNADPEFIAYFESLQSPHGDVKSDLCDNLRILQARFQKDFAWLKDADQSSYDELLSTLHGSYASEYKIIYYAAQVCEAIKCHGLSENTQAVVTDYILQSKSQIASLNEYARNAGILLLSVDEYEKALNQDGPGDPRILVLNEIRHVDNQKHITFMNTKAESISIVDSSVNTMNETNLRGTENGRVNPWISGSFYLVAALTVVALLLVVSRAAPWYSLPLVVIGGLLFTCVLGALQLKNDRSISDMSFLKLMAITLQYLPLIKVFAKPRKSDSD